MSKLLKLQQYLINGNEKQDEEIISRFESNVEEVKSLKNILKTTLSLLRISNTRLQQLKQKKADKKEIESVEKTYNQIEQKLKVFCEANIVLLWHFFGKSIENSSSQNSNSKTVLTSSINSMVILDKDQIDFLNKYFSVMIPIKRACIKIT